MTVTIAMLAQALLVGLLSAGPAAETGNDAALARSLLRRVEERQARTSDLVARFVQGYRSGMLGREIVERGVVSIKRPGRMRWEYKDPEPKLFVSDGRSFWFYVPADKQVIVREQDDQRSLAGRLLSGKGGLLDEFDAALAEPLEEGVLRLQLTPRQSETELKRAFVDVEPSGRIRSILIEDLQGNRTRFRFENVRENAGLPDKLFHFELPPGVEVIRG
jgi:outer membrane lipoprotein carrier protein